MQTENEHTDQTQQEAPAPAAEPSRELAKRAVVPISDGSLKPADLDGVWRIAHMLFGTRSMIPPAFKTAHEVAHAILFGQELGLSPLQAVQAVMVVNNRPTIWGDAAIALVRSRGRCVGIHERIEGEGDKMVAICSAKRYHDLPGFKTEYEVIERTFSVDDAKAAGLWGKVGPWKQYPKRMLQMRARSWALRDGFADVLRGVGIREEAEDFAFDPKRMKGVAGRDAERVEVIDQALPEDPRHVAALNGRT